MIKDYSREKLIAAVVYFAAQTRHCGKIKLFKLLYLLDFEHFRQTGRSVTGLEYAAWRHGPVPVSLADEWDEPDEDLARAVQIEPKLILDFVRKTVRPLVDFDASHFTARELRVMGELARRYKDTYAKNMVEVTHAENGAWARVWNNGEGQNKRIDYELAIPDTDPARPAILEAAADYKAVA